MPTPTEYILCGLDTLRIAIPTDSLLEVILSVEITPVKGGYKLIEGVFNYRGKLIALLDIRSRLNLAYCPLDVDQYFLILRSCDNLLAIRVDTLFDTINISALQLSQGVNIPSSPSAPLIIKVKDEILAVCDLNGLISDDAVFELSTLSQALESNSLK
jgi:chemotaxis signal transduction protein